MISVGTIDALWRYPVKSMVGEQLTQAPVDARGILGDRLYAVRDTDGKLGSGKNTRRFRRMDGLLDFRATYESGLTPEITLPNGQTVRGDDEHVHWAIANALGKPGVTLAKEDVISHFDEQPLHIVTSASLTWLSDLAPQSEIDPRRVRPNLVIKVAETAGRPEDAWIGRELRIGTHLVIVVVGRAERCAMMNEAQEELPHSSDILRAVTEANDMFFGVHAQVRIPGRIRVGDDVFLD
ncbi:MAG TPA: MOSC domain-containing protein [Pseudonocardiaceae bacterium]|nr:MOSC domain-containing protein [Pseudonocardiaceae bacterium]